MAEVIRQITQESLANSKLIELLKGLLERAKSGEVKAICAVVESRTGHYEYSRTGFSIQEAIGVLDRAKYDLHKQWDNV